MYKDKKDQALASKKHYDLNKEKIKARALLYNKKVKEDTRKYIIDYLKKHPCVDCGEEDIVVLEFDHKDRENKKYVISQALGNKISIKNVIAEIEKCEVRCANCHRRKTAVEFGFYKTKI